VSEGNYGSASLEGIRLRTCWHRLVIVMTECAWGVLDGSNDACFGTKGVS
jgi:hypothetical protein